MCDAPIPPSLTDLQKWFSQMISSPYSKTNDANLPIYPQSKIEEIRKWIAPSSTLKSEERIEIYQQQYWWRLLTVLQEIYPTLVRLFGYTDFNRMIGEPFFSSHPPDDWFLPQIGSFLPDWIEKNYWEKDKALVFETARIDWAYEKLIYADILPKISPEQFEERTMYLQPFVFLFELGSDLFSFREELLKHPASHWIDQDFPEIRKFQGKKHFVLYRQYEIDRFEEITFERFIFFSRLKKGAKLDELFDFLAKCGDVTELFQTVSSRNWLTFENTSEIL